MGRTTQITIWISCILIVLIAAIWTYSDRTKLQKMSEHANRAIESGVALFNEEKYLEALDVFKGIPVGVEREWYARYYQGSAHIMLKDYQSAIPYLEQALALNPTETQVMHALGVAYFKMGKLNMAKAYYKSILEIVPQDNEARGLLEAITNMERRQAEIANPGSQ